MKENDLQKNQDIDGSANYGRHIALRDMDLDEEDAADLERAIKASEAATRQGKTILAKQPKSSGQKIPSFLILN